MMHRALETAALWMTVAALACAGCGRSQAEKSGSPAPDAGPVKPPVKATDPDPEAMDEALVDALAELRDKFKCNRISGCPAHDVVRGYGWKARPYLERMFPRASRQATWRSRVVLIIAQLEDPAAEPFLVGAQRDRDDAVRAFATYGLGLLRLEVHAERFRQLTKAGVGLQFAMTRLSAWTALRRLGDRDAARGFGEELGVRCRQFLASKAAWWGLKLCRLDGRDAMSCRPHVEAAARHPGFVVRREAALWLTERGTKADIAVGRALAADPINSIARRAKSWLSRYE